MLTRCRLKATGVVDVENPVREAYQSGRIQELPDSDEEKDSDEEDGKKNGKEAKDTKAKPKEE